MGLGEDHQHQLQALLNVKPMSARFFIKKWAEAKGRQHQYQLLRNAIKRIYRNTDLIRFMEELQQYMGSKEDQKLLLHWCKRIILSTKRQPDPDHLEAFQEVYQMEMAAIAEEQAEHDPIKWLDHELQCLEINLNELMITKPSNEPAGMPSFQQATIPTDIYTIDKELLSAKEIMKLLDISKTSLDRRRADGLRAIKDGRKVYFQKKEVIRYLESKRF